MFAVAVEDREVSAALQRLADAMGDLSPALQAIGDDWAELARLGFVGGQSPYGDAWAPVKFRMIGEGKDQVQGDPGQPLRDTGALMNSIASNVYVEGGDTLYVGSDLIYARVHQFGAVIKPRNEKALKFPTPEGFAILQSVTIPQRQYLPTDGLPEEWSRTAIDAVNSFLSAQIGA